MARIDRLQDSIKDVLFSASVIGREFSSPLLEQVIERRTVIAPSLDQLQSLELILPKSQAQEFDFLFKHYLIQEVAYNTILVNKRKELEPAEETGTYRLTDNGRLAWAAIKHSPRYLNRAASATLQ